MDRFQPAILPGVPPAGRYLSFSLSPSAGPEQSLSLVQALEVDECIAVGIGPQLVALWGGQVPGLRTFPALSGPGVEVPSTQHALWFWLRGEDRGDLVRRGIALSGRLEDVFQSAGVIDAFKFGSDEMGRDLTGYEDGTENPTGDDAVEAAFVAEGPDGLVGSSFVAVQTWQHDLRAFDALPQGEQDQIIGRRISDNTELADAPESAHVKRTEQESFSPEAFVLRRSMPFADPAGEGLQFVAFGHSLDAFEVQMRRMVGEDDGITDALFRFSRPVSGAYYWCPPLLDGRMDLRMVGG